jgi:RES domain-containing protein
MHSGGDWPSIRVERKHAEIWVGASENINGVLTPSVVTLCADNVDLTPEQARRYAGYVLGAANTA